MKQFSIYGLTVKQFRGVSVPRVLLKNGKRSRTDLQGSQQCEIVRKSNFFGESIVREDLKSGESPDLACGSNIASGGDTAYRSMVNKSVSDLRVKVSNLEEAMKRCQGNVKPLRRYAPCWLHVIAVCSIRVGKEELSTQ